MGRFSLQSRLVDRKHWAEGATAIEYAIMVALVAGLIIAIVVTLGLQTARLFERADSNLNEATSEQ